ARRMAGHRSYPLTLACGIVGRNERSLMADTDDDQTVELEPKQHVQGEDDPTEAASERRATRAQERDGEERLAAVVGLTPEEAAARRQAERDERLATEEVEAAAVEDEIARVNAEDRELAEHRLRKEVQAADTARAIELANIAESAANRHRRLA